MVEKAESWVLYGVDRIVRGERGGVNEVAERIWSMQEGKAGEER